MPRKRKVVEESTEPVSTEAAVAIVESSTSTESAAQTEAESFFTPPPESLARQAQKKYRRENPDRIRFNKQKSKYFKKTRVLLSASSRHDQHWNNAKSHLPLWRRIHPNTFFDVAIHYSFWQSHRFLFGIDKTPNSNQYPQLGQWLIRNQSTLTTTSLNIPPSDEIKAMFEQVNEKKRWFPLFADLLAFWATFIEKSCPSYATLFREMGEGQSSEKDENEESEQAIEEQSVQVEQNKPREPAIVEQEKKKE